MKKLLLVFILSLAFTFSKAQQLFPIFQDSNRIMLNEVTILNPDRFGNDTLLYRYNQMNLYVGQILPLVDRAVKMFYEIETATAGMSRSKKRRYVENRQHEIKINFEDKLRDLNNTQGEYLVRAINRNLGKTVYDILKGYNKPLKAVYYRTMGNFYGIDLDEVYRPEEHKNFEDIMKRYGY